MLVQQDLIIKIFIGDVVLTTQTEVDDFGKNNYEKIEGNVFIAPTTGSQSRVIKHFKNLFEF